VATEKRYLLHQKNAQKIKETGARDATEKMGNQSSELELCTA
jgi:hypothetical protein